MSQSKVEKRKYEKKHRAQMMKKQKAKKAVAVFIAVLVICGILAITVGYPIYKKMPKYVKADKIEKVVEDTWKESGNAGILPATNTDAESEDSLE